MGGLEASNPLFLRPNRSSPEIQRARALLACAPKQTEKKAESWQESLLRLTGIGVGRCPVCGERAMRTVEIINPMRYKGPPRI